MLNLLRPALATDSEALRRSFEQATPFRHLILDSFLADNFCAELLEEFPPFDERKAVNEIGVVGSKAVVERLPSIGPAYRLFDQLIQSNDFLAFIGRITGIPGLLYDPAYFGGGTHENRSGQDLDIHVDFNYHPVTSTHRRLNLIVFLNPQWEAGWGGCLELHRNPWAPPAEDFTETILPLYNRCVIFETTETSWHGFRRIQIPEEHRDISRRSVAVYFYSKSRPEQERAARHSTVYVPWPAPEWLQAGHTLTPDDLDSLELSLYRRDALIRFLYEREKEFSAALEAERQKVLGRVIRKLRRWLHL